LKDTVKKQIPVLTTREGPVCTFCVADDVNTCFTSLFTILGLSKGESSPDDWDKPFFSNSFPSDGLIGSPADLMTLTGNADAGINLAAGIWWKANFAGIDCEYWTALGMFCFVKEDDTAGVLICPGRLEGIVSPVEWGGGISLVGEELSCGWDGGVDDGGGRRRPWVGDTGADLKITW